MNSILKKTILFPSLLLSSLISENVTAAPYWGIPDTRLPYIAMVRENPNGTTIVIYNPDTCKEIGVACGFFIEHAGAHAHRNHILLPPEAYPAMLEAEADCWAAKYGRSEEVYAVVQLFLDDNRNRNLNITGELSQRAEKIRACAEKAGNWRKDK